MKIKSSELFTIFHGNFNSIIIAIMSAQAIISIEKYSKILINCVSFLFQILPADRMSNRACHACISFLNSWQSFKNRCYAAQKKQQNFLDLLMAKERAKQRAENDRQRQLQQSKSSGDNDQQRILKNALLNSTMRSTSNNNSSIDVVSTWTILVLLFAIVIQFNSMSI